MLGTLAQLHRRLLQWYDRNRRDLPWRVRPDAPAGTLPDPYHVLISEAMLQQTQVATVIPYFQRFIARLPTLIALAEADEQEVLRLWQGLGYYSRARNLQGTAKILTEQYGGRVPSSVEELLSLPGVGRYTAGAIASLAFDLRAPILDGNVIRVLCRLDKVESDPRQGNVRRQLWDRAEQVLPPQRVGDFNSALMELGATICTARAPKCLLCPIREQCEALAAGATERIPPSAKPKDRPLERRWTLCIHSGQHWLIEQRPATGRWARMWQFITVPAGQAHPTQRTTAAMTGIPTGRLRHVGIVTHELTHRRYEFDVFIAEAKGGNDRHADPVRPDDDTRCIRRWVRLDSLSDYPLPRPHLRIAEVLRKGITESKQGQ